jgi:adenylate cyclase
MVGLYIGKRNYENAVKEAQKAISVAPGAASAYAKLAQALHFSGRNHEAIDNYKKAIRIDPFPSSWYYLELGFAYFLTGNYQEAVRVGRKACALTPDNEGCHRTLAAAYGMLGKDTEARAEAAELLRIMPEWSIEGWKQRQGDLWKKQTDVDHFVEGLRRAGLPEKPPLPLPDKPSIAVLPFVNMSGNPEQEYLSDGITESIITALSNVRNMFVISRNSTFTYKGKPVKIKQVVEDLGVHYVLEGSVQKTEDRIRITVQLIDALAGKHMWAERYDRDLKDLFALQDEITLKIITALRVKLTEGEHIALDTDNLDAYQKFLQARKQQEKKTKEGNALAQKLMEEAIALDPEYATGYLTLAATHLMDIIYGLSESPKQSVQTAEELVQKAISLSGKNADAHVYLARIYLVKRQYDEAIAEGKLAVGMAPNSAFAHAALASTLKYVEKPEEAITLYKKAIRLSPISDSWYYGGLGDCYGMLGRHEEAISAYKKTISLSPESPGYHALLAANYILAGREEEGRAEIAKTMEIDPKYSLERARTGSLYRDPSYLNRMTNAMRKAGLPE